MYSNVGGALAGLVVARAAKMPCRDYVTKTLLSPLGMTSSTWDPDPALKDRTASGHRRKDAGWVPSTAGEVLGAVESAGGLYTTVRDLARYAAFQLDAWPPRDAPDTGPVRRASLREAHVAAGHQAASRELTGVFWSVVSHCKVGHLVFHNGSMAEGFRSSLYLLPQLDLGIVLLANGIDTAKVDLDDLAEKALSTVAENEVKALAGVDEAMVAFRSLLAKREPDALRKLFADTWFEKPGDLEDLQRFLVKLGASTGACGSHAWLRPTSSRGGIAEVACDKRTLEVTLSVSAADRKRISGLYVVTRVPCK